MSKALERSTKSAAQCFFSSNAETMLFKTKVKAEAVLWPALKPDWNGLRMEALARNVFN